MRDLTQRGSPVDWGDAARLLIDAGWEGNAINIGVSEALWILEEWRVSRVPAAAGSALIALALLTGAVYLLTVAVWVGGAVGFAIAFLMIGLAHVLGGHPIWRIPLALTLVRHKLVHP